MGPYCRFCNTRCFVYFPEKTPLKALKAYGFSTIIATCKGGQAFEKVDTGGWCHDEILKAIKAEN